MFSRHERLKQRTPKDGVDRPKYLKQLVNEFRTNTSIQNKEQTLANLANFAYDPINYSWLKSLKVVDLFLDQLAESNLTLIRFAIGGLCNLCVDTENSEYLLQSKATDAIIRCLFSEDEQTVSSALTCLLYILNPGMENEDVVERMKQLSSSTNSRSKNLATIFLQDYCPKIPLDRNSVRVLV